MTLCVYFDEIEVTTIAIDETRIFEIKATNALPFLSSLTELVVWWGQRICQKVYCTCTAAYKTCCIFFPSSSSSLFELVGLWRKKFSMWRFLLNSDDLKENARRKREVATGWLNIASWHNLFFELHISSTEKVVGILFFITRQSNEVKPALGL